MFTFEQLPQISRILETMSRIETSRKDRFAKANPYLALDNDYMHFLQPWQINLRRKLADESHRLEQFQCYGARGLSNNVDLKEHISLVSRVARAMKIPRSQLRSKTLQELRSLARPSSPIYTTQRAMGI